MSAHEKDGPQLFVSEAMKQGDPPMIERSIFCIPQCQMQRACKKECMTASGAQARYELGVTEGALLAAFNRLANGDRLAVIATHGAIIERAKRRAKL